MAQTGSQSISREKFLVMSTNLLHKAFVENSRTDAKNIYKSLSEGSPVHLTTVQMEDKSTVRFNLTLDHSEFRGKLNYGAFRASLTALISNLSRSLQEKKDIKVFNAQGDEESMIFGVTGVAYEKDVPSVLVLGANSGTDTAAVTLRLMYLDHSQFMEERGEQASDTQAEDEQTA